MVKPDAPFRRHIDRRQLVILAVIVLGMYVVVPQLGSFRSSWHLLSHPQPAWTMLAVVLTASTYAAGALTYRLLAFHSLRYGELLLIQVAAMFVNRLLPAGLGALGVNFAYLKHRRHRSVEAASVVAVNNCLGFAGHGILVGCVLLLPLNSQVRAAGAFGRPALELIILVAALALAAGIAVLGSSKIKRAIGQLLAQLWAYRRRPGRLVLALFSSIGLTICNILALYCCAQALGIQIDPATMLIIFTFGIGLGTAVPTPGGLGAFEAGLVAGFAAYGVPAATALAAALLYRLVSYWLPLAVGAVAFGVAERRRLFGSL